MSKLYTTIENERGVSKSQIADKILDIELHYSSNGKKEDSSKLSRIQICEELEGVICIKVDGLLVLTHEPKKELKRWKMKSIEP